MRRTQWYSTVSAWTYNDSGGRDVENVLSDCTQTYRIKKWSHRKWVGMNDHAVCGNMVDAAL